MLLGYYVVHEESPVVPQAMSIASLGDNTASLAA